MRHWFNDEILSGPVVVPVTRTEAAGETSIDASHDGYKRSFGLIHQRKMTLQSDGGRLGGRDSLTATQGSELGEASYAIRFHIHPSVAVSRIWEGSGVMLRTAGGAVLTFEAGGLPVDVEESIFFAAPEGPRSCEQIVVYGVAADINEISWSFSILAADAPDLRTTNADRL